MTLPSNVARYLPGLAPLQLEVRPLVDSPEAADCQAFQDALPRLAAHFSAAVIGRKAHYYDNDTSVGGDPFLYYLDAAGSPVPEETLDGVPDMRRRDRSLRWLTHTLISRQDETSTRFAFITAGAIFHTLASYGTDDFVAVTLAANPAAGFACYSPPAAVESALRAFAARAALPHILLPAPNLVEGLSAHEQLELVQVQREFDPDTLAWLKSVARFEVESHTLILERPSACPDYLALIRYHDDGFLSGWGNSDEDVIRHLVAFVHAPG